MIYSKQHSYAVIGVFILLSVFASCSHADDLSGLYGVASIGRGEFFNSVDTQNRAWAQEGFDQRYNSVTPVYSLGIGYKPSDYIAYELAYHDLGKYTQYGAWGCNDDESSCGPTRYGYSESRTRGVAISALPQWGPFYARVGALRYRSTWNTFYSDADPYNKTFNDYRAQWQYGWSPVFGLGLKFNRVTIEFDRYTVIKPHDGSIQGTNTISIGYLF